MNNIHGVDFNGFNRANCICVELRKPSGDPRHGSTAKLSPPRIVSPPMTYGLSPQGLESVMPALTLIIGGYYRLVPMITNSIIYIGRSEKNDVRVEPHHLPDMAARIIFDGTRCRITDLKTGNELTLNNAPVSQENTFVRNGSKIMIGGVPITVVYERIFRDDVYYRILNKPARLEAGMNIPGQDPEGREIVAIRDDEATRQFITAASSYGRGGLWQKLFNNSQAEVAKRVYSLTRQTFTTTVADDEKGWKILEKTYKGEKVSLGYCVIMRSGCCRHQAAALQLAYQHLGFNSRFVRGGFKILKEINGENSRHAWVEVEIGGKWYYADPAQGIFRPKDELGPGYYEEGENFVEVPITSFGEPGAMGTVLGPQPR